MNVSNTPKPLFHLRTLPKSVQALNTKLTSTSLAAKGCDGLIFQLVDDLFAAGIVKVVEAGQTIAGGEILLRRGWGA